MKRPRFIICVLLLLLSLPLQASAFSTNKWYAGVQLGAEFLTSHTDENWDDAVAFGIYGGYRIDRQLSLEGNLTTARHDGIGDSELDVTSILFGPRISGYVNRNVEIYADAGLGIDFLDYNYGPFNDSYTRSGLYLGAGIEFPIQSMIKLGLDFKYQALFSNDPINSDIITLLVRFGF
jgi:opacity protein-like surface antigen